MNVPTSLKKVSRLPCLDGWRCMSILLVLLNHSRQLPGYDPSWDTFVRWFPDGRFGVEVFFVISGFLITFLLLKEREKTGTICLKMFYVRRILRIIPVYLTFLIILFALCRVTELKISFGHWLSLLIFTENYIKTEWVPYKHIWSLCVEEQFYLIWPLIISMVSGKVHSSKKLLLILLIPVLLAPVCRVYGYVHPQSILFNKNSFFNCCDSLAIGCLLSVLMGFHGVAIEKMVRMRSIILVFIGALLVMLPLVLTRLLKLGVFTVPFGVTCNAMGIAFLVLVSLIRPDLSCFRWLEWRPIAAVGVISYSLYLWQQLFCTSTKDYGLPSTPWFLSFPFWILASFCIAVISYNFIEQPFIRLKARIQSKA